jgi:Putative Actinobacterial Holin-X, holin superfamily III
VEELQMLAPSSDLLRAGVGLKLNQVKRATRSYLRDRTNQATGTATSYAMAAGLFAAAGIFLLAACFVGIFALFRWVELNYGMFPAFGAVGGLLVVIAAILAGVAAMKLRQKPREFPSLASRLRVALTANPLRSVEIDQAEDGATPVAQTAAPRFVPAQPPRRGVFDKNVQAGLAAAALLLGWVAARRRQQARRTAV